ncbi:hypothetical protein HDU92_009098 [Lobulomyces angularis]|nr:hypothetical protein HDU92_009098 [Lobulomyces angularis]
MSSFETKEGFFNGHQNCQIYYKIWKPTGQIIARVVAVHGLGDHISRYDHVFSEFAENGIIVRGLDWRGHGKTYENHKKDKALKPLKGFHDSFEHIYEDLVILNTVEINESEKNLPTFLFGHSLGALIALGFSISKTFTKVENFAGIVSQASALKSHTPIPMWVKIALSLATVNAFGRYTDGNRLELNGVSTSKEEIQKYLDDPLVHEKISLRLVKDLTDTADKLRKFSPNFKHPIFLVHSKSDILTHYEGSKEFYETCGSTDKKYKEYEKLGHELHNEPSIQKELITNYIEWVLARSVQKEL